jgi:hypothetical protein
MANITLNKNIPAGQPLWEGSRLKSTGFTYLNKEEISVQKFYASYLIYYESFSKHNQEIIECYLDGLIEKKITLMPDNETLSEIPELQKICKLIRKLILLEAATFQIDYLLNTQ